MLAATVMLHVPTGTFQNWYEPVLSVSVVLLITRFRLLPPMTDARPNMLRRSHPLTRPEKIHLRLVEIFDCAVVTIKKRIGARRTLRMLHSIRSVRLAPILLIVTTAQSMFPQASDGNIVGVVRDQTDATVGRASVTLNNTETGISRTTDTDNTGYTSSGMSP